MATTIQTIETPKRARALDTSSGWQKVGGELITDVQDRDFSAALGSGDTDCHWTVFDPYANSSPTFSIDSGRLKVVTTTDTAREGFEIAMSNLTAPTAGKRYRITCDLQATTAGFTLTMGFGGATTTQAITTSNTTYNIDITPDNTSGTLRFYTAESTARTWHMDNISVQEIRNFPNNNHGQIYSGRGLEFDGVTDYLDIGAITTFVDFSAETTQANRAWTVAAWINIDSTNPGWIQNVIGSTGAVSSTYIGIGGDSTYNGRMVIWDSGASQWRSNNTTLNINTWHRAAWVFDGDTTVTFYLNGIADGTGALGNSGIEADLIMRYIGARDAGHATTTTERLFVGKMADVQLWKGAFTADDASYDYLNPESLALNRGGTSLTNSNLLAWYPMQDGHRGQQSYILDASNTGLGDDLITNGGFDTNLSSWEIRNATGANQVTFDNGTAKLTYDNTVSTDALGIRQDILTTGVTYKLTMDVVSISGNGVKYYSGSTEHDTLIGTGSHTFYFTAGGSEFTIYRSNSGSASISTIDNVVVKPVNDKNNATTVFYGDEEAVNGDFETFPTLHASNDDTFTDESVDGNQNVTMVTETGVYNSGSKSAKATLNDTSGHITYNKTDYVVGRTYEASVAMRAGGSQTITNFQMYAAETIRGTATAGSAITPTGGFQTASVTFVATATTMFVNMNFTGTNGHYSFIDDFSIKEVGIASGWTDADQQLHIPQTALQSYNELLWFPGNDALAHGGNDYDVTIADNAALDNIFDGGGAISIWFFPVSDGIDHDYARLLHKGYWQLYINGSTATSSYVTFKQHCTNSSYSTTRTDAKDVKIGEWNHLVVTYNASTPATPPKFYLNAEERTPNETADPGSETRLDDDGQGLIFGNTPDGTRTFDGTMTEISFWTNTLTQAEINELYNDGKALDATTHSSYISTPANLKGYWRNNGLSTWTDLSDNSNNGTVNNITETMLIPQGLDGRDSQGFIMNRQRNTSSLNFINKAGLGDDALDRVEAVPFTDLIADGASTASIECWVKANGTAGSDDYCTFAGERTSKNVLLCGRTSTNRPAAVYRLSSSGNINALESTADNIFDGDWHHIAFTFGDGDGVAKLYIDGTQSCPLNSDTQTHAGETLDNDHALFYVGGGDGGQDRNFNGMVDGVRVYSDALSESEVKRNYNATKGSHRN